jgi:arylsulfatase A-like enzyme
MLTGLYPLRHGVRDNGLEALPPSAQTLAERAQAAGFETAAFVSSSVLAAPFGLDQGFRVYDAPTDSSTSAVRLIAERSSKDTPRETCSATSTIAEAILV